MENGRKKNSIFSRRHFLRGASTVGLGATILSYQNCSPVNFSIEKAALSSEPPGPPPVKIKGCRNPVLPFDYPFYAEDGRINDYPVYTQAAPGNMAAVAAEHQLNVGLWRTTYYNQDDGTNNNKAYLLTVDVGADPQSGIYHPMSSSNFANTNTVTDVYVYDDQTSLDDEGNVVGDYVLIHWRRFGSADFQPSAMFVMDGAFVESQPKLRIVTRCQEHGYWMEELDLSQVAPKDYALAVPAADTAMKFAGTTIYRPYVALSATGGQGDLGLKHTPTIQVIDNNTVDVILGPSGARHGVDSESHYPAGAMLYDQEGHRLGQHVVLNIASAGAAHVFRFTNVNMSERSVKVLRAVVQDTFNGHLMGFKKIVIT